MPSFPFCLDSYYIPVRSLISQLPFFICSSFLFLFQPEPFAVILTSGEGRENTRGVGTASISFLVSDFQPLNEAEPATTKEEEKNNKIKKEKRRALANTGSLLDRLAGAIRETVQLHRHYCGLRRRLFAPTCQKERRISSDQHRYSDDRCR